MVTLAVPVVLSELGWMAMGVVDTIMVGRLGPAAIGAVALGNAICYTPSHVWHGAHAGAGYAGGAGLRAQRSRRVPSLAGAGRVSGMHCRRAHHAGDLAGEHCIRSRSALRRKWPGRRADICALLNWGTLPLLLYGATRRYLQGVGQVRVITVTYVLANLVNWFGNWVLIYGKLGFPALGVNGSAISTAFARVTMAAALLGFAWRYERGRGHPLFQHWAAPQAARLKRLLQLGAPAAGQILLEVGAWNLATLSAGYLTPVALATHQIVLNYASVTYMVPLGISAAAAVSVGHAVGAGDAARARRAGWMALGLGTSFMLLAALAFLLWPRPLIELLYSRSARAGRGPRAVGDCRGLRDLRRHPDRIHGRAARAGRDAARRCGPTWWATGCWDCRSVFFFASD